MNGRANSETYNKLLGQFQSDPLSLRNTDLEACNFSDKQITQLYLVAVKGDGKALEFVPLAKRSKKICVEAVNNKARALAFVPDLLKDKDMCMRAVKEFPFVLKFVPNELRDRDIYITAIDVFPGKIKDVPPDRKDILLEAIERNWEALEHIPEEHLDLDCCVLAVGKNGAALKFVPKKYKEDVIKAVSLKKILSDDYRNRQFLPENVDYQPSINEFLSGIKHFVIVSEQHSFQKFPEYSDIYSIYVNSLSQPGTVIWTNRADAQRLFDTLPNKENINLILLSHHTRKNTESIADMTVNEIADFFKKNDSIDQITLLGCNTAKLLKLDDEVLKIQQFAATKKNSPPVHMV